MLHWLLLLSCFISTVSSAESTENLAVKFCESYAECTSVALLEERLCLGNSRKRPYWLPNRHDPKQCHQKLKNDYRTIELLEVELENQFIACLSENSEPNSDSQNPSCSAQLLSSVPRFSFGRTITYVPTNCFTGLERRKERECGEAKKCCEAVTKCESVLTESSVANTIDSLRTNLLKRAKDCEKGTTIAELASPDGYLMSNDVDQSWSPTGHVNVRITDEETKARTQQRQNSEANTDKPGFVNVRFSTAEKEQNENPKETLEERARRILTRKGDNFNSHGNGVMGEVSNPTGGDHLDKAQFPKLLGIGEETNSAGLVETEDGSLTIGQKTKEPTLDFPDEASPEASQPESQTSEERREDERKRGNLPKNLDEHDAQFEKALRHTNDYKNKIKSLEQNARSESINEGINSLLDAGKASHGRVGVATGSMHKMPMTIQGEDWDLTSTGDFVTSSPLILVKKQQKVSPPAGCSARPYSAKTLKFEKILAALGEKIDSADMVEMRDLIDAWHNNFRKKMVTAKDKAMNKEIEQSLEQLIKHFDDVNLSLIKAQANATFSSDDYPNEDAELADVECDPVTSENTEEEERRKDNVIAQLIDDHGDTVIVDDGIAKIVLSGGGSNFSRSSNESDVETSTPWHNEEYKKEVAKFRKEHNLDRNNTVLRNETTCDLYIRCRNQMHIAVDGCAWRFATDELIASLAESAESLLYKGEEPCDPSHQPLYEELYEMLIHRNGNLRSCLDTKNEKFFADSVCMPYDKSEQAVYNDAMRRILSASYADPVSCYMDANKIQEKCSKLRECCPNFDQCREEELDISLEQAVISMTARINESKQECIKEKARKAFKKTLRGLLGKGSSDSLRMLKDGSLGLDIRKGAEMLRRMRR